LLSEKCPSSSASTTSLNVPPVSTAILKDMGRLLPSC
jgi:hypothetical protein